MAIHRKSAPLALLPALALVLAACGGGDDGGGDTGGDAGAGDNGGGGETVELTFAHSYTEDHPHHRCGAQVIADEVNGMDVGLDIQIFPNSTLGADADRFTSLMSGDIDLDLQGSSAISSSFPLIGVLDAAYVFDGPDHMFQYFDGEESEDLEAQLLEATGTRAIEPFFFGMRTFSANSPITSPEDLQGLRMRFPDTPAYLANAEAMGAEAVAVAFEEIYLALQQGIIDGQENPIPTVESMSLDEVQSHVSLNEHQTGFQLLLINDERWQSLSTEQQDALTEVAADVREQNRQCIEEAEEEIIAEWEETGEVEVVRDVDKAAFSEMAEAYFTEQYSGAELELYESIRNSAP